MHSSVSSTFMVFFCLVPLSWKTRTVTNNTPSLAFAQTDGDDGNENTTAPTPSPNDCDEFLAGNIYFSTIFATNPNLIVMLPYEDIPGGMNLYLTTNAWTGSGFQSNEGTLELEVPAEGIPQGTNFAYGGNFLHSNDWELVEGNFALSRMGEQIFLYCFGSMDVIPLAAISYNGPFQQPGLESYAVNESALPERLETNGTIVLQHCDQWEYEGVSSARLEVLKRSMANPNNWEGSSCTFSKASTLLLQWASTSFLLSVSVAATLLLL